MHVARIRLIGVGPFSDLSLSLVDREGAPRPCVVVLGGGGVGKTSLLAALASTRPGYAVALPRMRVSGATAPQHQPAAIVDWMLGDDDPARPHPLRLSSPNISLDEPESVALLRRREQALFDKRALEGGFALVTFSAARWFSRAPLIISAPDRTILRYDVRAPASFDDATRADLARETKQTLAYATIAAALASYDPKRSAALADAPGSAVFDRALRYVVGALASLVSVEYLGIDPETLEPMFSREGSAPCTFDDLPTSVRHLFSIGTLTLRTLHAAFPQKDPCTVEGVALVDDIGLHLDPRVQQALIPTLRRVLPRVQWIVTTSSPAVTMGCDEGDVVALRRLSPAHPVEVYEGPLAIVH